MIHFFSHLSDKFLPMGLSEFLKKTFVDPKSSMNEAGQALIEYILILVITVSIILGVMYQFSEGFKTFVNQYFGDYIACLLETGELPSLGGSGPNQGQCVSPVLKVSARSKIDGARQSGGAGGNTSSPTNNSSGTNNNNGGGGGNGLSPSVVTGSGAPTNAEAVGNTSAGRPARQKLSKNSSGSSGFDSASGDSDGVRSGRVIRRKKIIYLGEEYIDEKKKEEKKAKSKKAKLTRKDSGTSKLRVSKFKLDVPEKRKVASVQQSEGFTFGVFIKFMLIAGIVIAIVVFLGGQALQIKKSWQKSE